MPQDKKTFKQIWQEARNKGLATFSWKGNDYNTKKAGESDAAWAKVLKGRGNTAIGAKAQYRVHYKGQDATVNERTGQVQKVNGGGFYATDTSGKRLKSGFKTREEAMAWIRKNTNNKGGRVFSEQKQTSTPYADQSAKASGRVKVTAGGTNNGTTTSRKTNNRGTTITVGKAPKGEQRKDYRPNGAKNTDGVSKVARNVSAGQFVDALLPTTAIGNAFDAAWKTISNGTYTPRIYKSGFNPFGYAEDAVNGNALGLGLRGLDLWASLGSPGAKEIIDQMGTKFAPRITNLGKVTYLTKEATEPVVNVAGEVVERLPNSWATRAITGNYTSPVRVYGQRSVQRAANEGVLGQFASRQSPNLMQNVKTGTSWLYNTPKLHPYDASVENAIQLAPWMTPAVDYSMQYMYNHNNDTE